MDPSGAWVFKADTLLPAGIYIAMLPNQAWFEIVVDNPQQFMLETDSIDPVGHMKITGSVENQVFYEYQQAMSAKQKEAQEWDSKVKADSANAGLKKEADLAKKKIDDFILNYRQEIIKKYPGFLFTRILMMMQEPEPPDFKDLGDSVKIQEAKYRYYKIPN